MPDKPVRLPGPDHPITLVRSQRRIVVRVAGNIIADTRDSVTLREANYPPVQYIPRKDVAMKLLQRTSHSSYCPYKGDAAYYSVPAGGERSVNAAWTYEAPFPAAAEIVGHLAFYPDRIESMEESMD